MLRVLKADCVPTITCTSVVPIAKSIIKLKCDRRQRNNQARSTSVEGDIRLGIFSLGKKYPKEYVLNV